MVCVKGERNEAMQKKYLYFMAAAHMCDDINSGALPAVLPFFVLNYGMDYTAVGGIMFASCFLSSVIQPVFGYLADRTQRNWFMGAGVLLAGLSFGATGFLTDYWAIFAAVTAMGIGSSIFHPEAARIVNSISGQQRGAGMSIFSVGGNAGFGVGPLLAVAVISAFGMAGLGLFGLLSLVMGAALFLLAPRIKAAAVQLQQEAASASSAAPGVKSRPRRAVNDWRAFSRLTLVIMFRSLTFSGISSFLPLFCIQVLGASNGVGSATLSVLSISGIAATLAGGWLADRWGYVAVLRRGCFLLVPLLAAAVFTKSIWMVYLMLIPMSFAMQGTYSSFVVLGQSYLAKSVGFASGVTLGLSFSVGGVLVPALGWYGDAYGIGAVMALVVLVSLLCALATLLLPRPEEAAMK